MNEKKSDCVAPEKTSLHGLTGIRVGSINTLGNVEVGLSL